MLTGLYSRLDPGRALYGEFEVYRSNSRALCIINGDDAFSMVTEIQVARSEIKHSRDGGGGIVQFHDQALKYF